MTEWQVLGVISAVIGVAVTVGAPIVKLNSTLTRLISKLDSLTRDFDEFTDRNRESHKRIFVKLDDHERRITLMEKKED